MAQNLVFIVLAKYAISSFGIMSGRILFPRTKADRNLAQRRYLVLTDLRTTAKLNAAKEFTHELDNLNEDEKAILEKSLEDLARDTPNTQVAAIKFKKLVAKAGRGAAEGLRSILVDVLSETAKKLIGL